MKHHQAAQRVLHLYLSLFLVALTGVLGIAPISYGQTVIRTHDGLNPGDRFGGVVAALGDLHGANGGFEADGFIDYGIASLGAGEVNIVSGWSGEIIRTHTGGRDSVEFGAALAGVGDVNSDGHIDYAIADPGARNAAGSPDAGKVIIFSGSTGVELWSVEGADAGDRLGTSLCVLGDLDQDGADELGIGVPGEDTAGSGAGAVQIYSTQSLAPYAQNSAIYGSSSGDSFGVSMDALGDVNGDGVPDIVVGAPLYEGTRGVNSGGVFVCSGADGSVICSAEGWFAGDQLGTSVCRASDRSGDGAADFAAGAPLADAGGSASGSVVVYSSEDGAIISSYSGASQGDNLGQAIASAGDADFDGTEDLLVGVPGADPSGPNSGSVMLFSGTDFSLLMSQDGESPFGRLGSSVAGLGRVDYDQYSDFAVGTDGASNVAGRVWILSEHINEPPSLVDDFYTTDEDTPLVFYPEVNDSDHDGYIVWSTLSLSNLTGEGSWSVSFTNERVTFTPEHNWFGEATIEYVFSDDDGAQGFPAKVTITVLPVNDAPVGVADEVVTDEDVPVLAFVTANDTDVDGAPVFSTIELLSGASNGTAVIDYAQGGILYTPAPNWFGTDSFAYRVQDDGGLWTEATTCTVIVNDVNDPPVAIDDAATGFQEFPLAVDVLANDYDIDGKIEASGITITTQPAHGTASVDPSQGVVVYTGGPGFAGTDSFKYTITDDDGDASSEAVAILTVLEDCNYNQVWDTEDIATGFSPDCNATGVPDECELDGNDCDTNGVPDECDPDCNANWRPDACDLVEVEGLDCDSNGVPDDCQVDCNQNGLPDNCDIELAVSRDCDLNGLPDECDGIRWVDVSAVDCNGDGSWSAPHCTLQQAIFASSPGDVIMALPGVYQETIDFAGRNVSLKSAAGMGVTFIDGQGNGPVVRFQANESPACLLQGFTVTGGSASGGQAGGVAISSASPTVRGCRIQGNTSSDFGAGASTRNNAHPRFYDCVFVGNDTGRNGGGMIVDNGTVQLYRCEFIDNSADDSGGGLFARNGANGVVRACTFRGNRANGEDGGGAFLDGVGLSFDRCEFSLNSAGELGGGVAVRNATGTPSFDDCSFDGNVAGESGGALSFDAVNVVLIGNSMRGNESLGRGGALYVANAPHVQIEGNELIGNSAGTLGGGLFLAAQGGWIRRCTSSENSAGLGGGGAYLVEYSTPTLDSCIFWGDTPDEVRVEVTPGATSGNKVSPVAFPDAVRYSCVQGGWPVGQGNISSDPMFRDILGGDFGLDVGSPCIDAGNPSISTDPDGSRADMGAEAYQGSAYIDVMTWNFSAGERIEPVVTAQSPAEVLVAASNYWQELRDNGYKERLHRLAELVVEEDPYIFHTETLIRARVRPVGGVLSGSSQGTYITAFDQAEILKEAMEYLGWGSYLGKSQVFDIVIPVITCDGYADVRLQGYQVSYMRESQPLHENLGFFNEQLTGSVGGIGEWSPTYGWRGFRAQDGSSPWIHFTNLDPSSSAGLQAVQAGELLTRLIVPSPENTEHAVLAGDFASTPGSPAYNMLVGAGFQDAWTPFGSGTGATCCQANDLLNSASQLSERRDWALSNDPLWSAKRAEVVGAGDADRALSGRWISTHAGLVTRWGTP